ncbi:hypothetical protein CEUSTIGMA_g1358.t1 [Chlamydomonas eustigma]|uniref:Peroxisomal biogenesis factor 11 n=1 Tax=Chlamydomonas eustigma TaxID=1157962 RepID=A0A250WSU1_9CHLO|nr:hypothetical protein CEUSTIGMA_g1358.t1 [Chlamydomonas eustigma]|eukprot:GAX73908.1 hypothetical protein CEUSTIGMA_g1358.t1 [Chlamydomonas eustigma]
MASNSNPDTIDKIIKYLAKREGIDKTLKLIRYSSKLVVALTATDSNLHQRCKSIDSSVGVSRKAFRLGKFLQDINSMRKSRATGHLFLLEFLAYGGEGVYFFLEQAVWLIKTGAMTKTHEKQIVYLSACAEFVGYLGSISLSFIKLKELTKLEQSLSEKLTKKREEDGVLDFQLEKKLAATKGLKALRIAAIIQDFADAAIAINDIRGGCDPIISHPVTLALAGLLSGSISSYKNWTA